MRQRAIFLATVGLLAAGCGDGGGPGLPPRTYLMGCSAIPPNFDTSNVIIAINNWVPHADAAIMHVSPPWAAMLGGATPDSAVRTVELPLAQYYRAKGLDIVFTVDATDGLNRAAEAPELASGFLRSPSGSSPHTSGWGRRPTSSGRWRRTLCIRRSSR